MPKLIVRDSPTRAHGQQNRFCSGVPEPLRSQTEEWDPKLARKALGHKKVATFAVFIQQAEMMTSSRCLGGKTIARNAAFFHMKISIHQCIVNIIEQMNTSHVAKAGEWSGRRSADAVEYRTVSVVRIYNSLYESSFNRNDNLWVP